MQLSCLACNQYIWALCVVPFVVSLFQSFTLLFTVHVRESFRGWPALSLRVVFIGVCYLCRALCVAESEHDISCTTCYYPDRITCQVGLLATRDEPEHGRSMPWSFRPCHLCLCHHGPDVCNGRAACRHGHCHPQHCESSVPPAAPSFKHLAG